MRFQKILAVRGIHYFVTRFGPASLRGAAFDEKYRRGDWRYGIEAEAQLREIVQQYLRGGDMLVLGCGESSVLEGLEAKGLNSAHGVDLSEAALELASRYASSKISFQKADMLQVQCPRDYDIILFSESLNYASVNDAQALLRRLAKNLKPGGVFVVTLAQGDRYRDLMEMVRTNFELIVDQKFPQSTRQLFVFCEKGKLPSNAPSKA